MSRLDCRLGGGSKGPKRSILVQGTDPKEQDDDSQDDSDCSDERSAREEMPMATTKATPKTTTLMKTMMTMKRTVVQPKRKKTSYMKMVRDIIYNTICHRRSDLYR